MTGNLPLPLKRQREVLYLPVTGHSAILGTAGSGKTTLALYRAAYLSMEGLPHSGKTLFLTFNNTLVTFLQHLKPAELCNVTVETYHKFARGYLSGRKKMRFNCICEENTPFVAQAVTAIRQVSSPSAFFDRPETFFCDEITWLQAHGIATLERYQQVERIGRSGTTLSRDLRPLMFQIYQTYLEIRKTKGFLYDWEDLATTVRSEFERDQSPRLYKHVIIDEGQDFSQEMLRSLAAAIPPDGSVTFFGDVAQQIYGQQTSWRSAGLTIPKVWEFKENYRNTRQIAQLGLAIARMPFFKDIPDMIEPTFTTAAGPLPMLIECSDFEKQKHTVIEIVQNEAQTKKVAVLFKDRHRDSFWQQALGVKAIKLHRDMLHWDNDPNIYFGTFHAAKGLEFDTVIIPQLEQSNIPDERYIREHDKDEALTYFGRLLYVGCTRAKSSLVLLYSGQLSQLLPSTESLYQRFRL